MFSINFILCYTVKPPNHENRNLRNNMETFVNSKLEVRAREGGEEDKTTLAQKDVRFARTIQRLQRVIVSELEKIGIIHLYTLGFRGDDLLSFSLALNNPSKIIVVL